MVSASKMSRAQKAALAGRPYAMQMNKMLASLRASDLEDIQHPFLEERGEQNPGVLVISTDKGLCGALNSNLFRELAQFGADATFVTIGRKIRQYLVRIGKDLLADFTLKDQPTPLETKQISQFLIDQFLAKKINSIQIIFPRFINTLTQQPCTIQILPIKQIYKVQAGACEQKEEILDAPPPREYLFEPKPKNVLDALLPYYVHFLVYQMILNARASEHSARMVAMKNATDNAQQLIKDLTLQYNKARQAGITTELLEISTAQMAME